MTDFSPLHAVALMQVVRESTRGYGPPTRDPLGRRPARPPREPRRGLRRVRI